MRIAVDGTALYGRYGGVEYALWNLLRALHDIDGENEYSVFVPHDSPALRHDTHFNTRWSFLPLPFYGVQKLRRVLWQQLLLPMQVQRQRADLLHSPTYILPVGGWLTAPRVKRVLTVYDTIALDTPHFATRANRLHYGALLPASLRAAHAIITPSAAVREAVDRHAHGAAGKTFVVAPGLDNSFLEEPSVQLVAAVRARYDLPPRYLLFVGNFEPKKNLTNLLQALHHLPVSLPLLLAGGARAWEKVPSTPRVRLLGYVPRDDLPVIYAGCAAFVFPSLAEGFGLPVLEALACGASVVTSHAVPIPQIEQCAALCDPHDPASIARAVERVLNDGALRARLTSTGRALAREFTWERAAQKTLEIYRRTA